MIGFAAGKRKPSGIAPARRPAAGRIPSRAQSRIAYAIGRLERSVRQRLAAATRRFGLTVSQYTALSVLHARGALSNAQLARRSFVTPQSMNEIIQSLTSSGILRRRPHARHGRIVQISLTRKGDRVLRRCDAAVARIEGVMLRHLSQSERAQLRTLLRSCVEALEH
ncbi:MAG TPA: MarR family transcriptional regulator [Steroidobacteraceae bacterium]|nr:MarR family transcriptional regulator [Steroidobacteraceae bacterium]